MNDYQPPEEQECDVKNLTDRDAEIHDALDNLMKVCEKYEVTGFARVILDYNNKNVKFLGMDTQPKDGKKHQNCYAYLMEILGAWIYKVTDGRLIIAENPENV